MINFFFAHSRYETREFGHITFEQLNAMAQNPRIGPKDTAPIFAPHDGNGRTVEIARQANFHALVLDFDEGNYSTSAIKMIMVDAGGFLAFTSSSHQQAKGSLPSQNRWKVIIPFNNSVGAEHYEKLAQGAAIKFRTDLAQARLAQVCHVPNKLHTDAPYEVIDCTDRPFIDPVSGDFARTCIATYEAHANQKQAKTRIETVQRLFKHTPSESIIGEINRIHSVGDILRDYGYKAVGSKFVAPHSTSGTPGVVVMTADDGTERVYSHHAPTSDILADGHAHDAFDLLKILRFGGDFATALAALSEGTWPEQRDPDPIVRSATGMGRVGNRASATATAATSATPWASVEPLMRRHVHSPSYPIDAVPPIMRLALQEVHEFTQAPMALIAMSAITAMAACVQAHFDVERASFLRGPTSLYGLILADSGERKTTVEGYFYAPIIAHDKRHRILGMEAMKVYKAEMELWEEEKKNRMRAINSCKDPEEKSSAMDLLRDHLDAMPEEPVIPKIGGADTTPEQLTYSLVRKWPSKVLHTSEAGVVFGGHGMKTDNVLKNLAVLNSAWGGQVDAIDRRTSESTPGSHGVRLSASLMVQPDVLAAFLSRTGSVARGSGFLARFLICWPASTQGYRPFRNPPQRWTALDALHAVMDDLLRRWPETDDEGQLEPEILQLSADGFQAWVAVHDAIERELRHGGDLHDVSDAASKAADNVARMAAVFHCAEQRDGGIEADLINSAARIVAWHMDEAKRLFAELVVPEAVQQAQTLLEWLIREAKSTGKAEISIRRISQYGPNALRKKAALHEALDLLAETNHLLIYGTPRSNLVMLNPDLLVAA